MLIGQSGLVPTSYIREALSNHLSAKHGFFPHLSQADAEKHLSIAVRDRWRSLMLRLSPWAPMFSAAILRLQRS